jgi:hypothetical protein
MKRQRRTPIYTADHDGKDIVIVPLGNSEKPAKLFREDFDRLMQVGISDQWLLAYGALGYEYVRCAASNRGRIQTVARLIMGAGKGQAVQYRDWSSSGRLNLRRDNLFLARGMSTNSAREELDWRASQKLRRRLEQKRARESETLPPPPLKGSNE